MKKCLFLLAFLVPVLSACAEAGDPTVTDAAQRGYLFICNGICFSVDEPAERVLVALGDPIDRYTAASCAFGGEDTVYYYPGFQISTNNEQGSERIYAIYLENASVCTEEGIGVGCTREEVREVYGQPDTASDSSLIYAKDGMTLRFNLTEGEVSSILYSVI